MSKFQFLKIIAIGLISVLLLIGGCKKKQAAAPSETRDVFGTKVTIAVYDQNQDPELLKKIFDEAFRILEDWDTRAYKPGPQNQVSAVSQGAGEQSVPVDAATFDLLMKAMRYYDNGGKTYDIRYGPLMDLWGFDSKPRVPTQAELDSVQQLVTQGGMFVAGNSILLARPQMKFDAREIVMGYAFDKVAARLVEMGLRTATISAPGVWRLMGDPPSKDGFEIKLMNPLMPDSVWTVVHAPAGGVAMASMAEGKFVSGGKSYHRILDPRSGFPANRAAAVVHSPDAITAEALAYSLFVTGSVDSFDTAGKQAVSGSIVVTESGGKLSERRTGIFGSGAVAEK